LVIECVSRYQWGEVFQGATVPSTNEELRVEQGTWDEISVVSYEKSLQITLLDRVNRTQRSFTPHLILMRSESKGHWGQDSTNKLMALMHSGIPAVNSIFSIYCFLQKPVIWQSLRRIEMELGHDDFPLVRQVLYPSFKEMVITPSVPCVGKIGSFDAAKGKAVLRTGEAVDDFRSIVAVQPAFVTLENFVNWDWDGRVQVIGPHIRVFKRQTESWKGNLGRGAVITDLAVTPQFERWANACRKVFGGLEMFGLDFVHDADNDRFVILELNGTACGLVARHENNDMLHMRDVALATLGAQDSSGDGASLASSAPPESAYNALQEQIRRLEAEATKLKQEVEVLKNPPKSNRSSLFFRR